MGQVGDTTVAHRTSKGRGRAEPGGRQRTSGEKREKSDSIVEKEAKETKDIVNNEARLREELHCR